MIYSKEGQFLPENLKRLPNQPDAVLTGSTASAILTATANSDIVLGNVSALGKTDSAIPFKSTRNVRLQATANGYEMQNLEGADGLNL